MSDVRHQITKLDKHVIQFNGGDMLLPAAVVSGLVRKGETAQGSMDYAALEPSELVTMVYRGLSQVTSRYDHPDCPVDQKYLDALRQEIIAKDTSVASPLDIATTKATTNRQRNIIENLYALIHCETFDPVARADSSFMTAPEKCTALLAAIAEIAQRQGAKKPVQCKY